MGLVTTAEVLIATKNQAVSGDPLYSQIDLLRKMMETATKKFCKWDLEANSGQGYGNFIEYYDGKSYPDIVLRKPWVSKTHSVKLTQLGAYGSYNQGFSEVDALTLGEDYSLVLEESGRCTSGILRRLGNNALLQGWWPSDRVFNTKAGGLSYNKGPVWPNGYGNIRVTYDWGFQPATAPSAGTWAANVATLTFPSAIVARPSDEFTITDAVPAAWNGDWQVATVSSDGLSITFRSVSDLGTLTTVGSATFIPYDIRAAVCQAVTIQRAQMQFGGRLANESLGDYSYGLNFDRENGFGAIKQLLAPYRNMVVGIGLI